MAISRAQMGSQLKGNRVKLDKAGFDPTTSAVRWLMKGGNNE